mgnify:CR=1 FL=1|jgi:uncharacterized membrane protein YeaQ/YmgE (transglycosylase-associated protein family)
MGLIIAIIVGGLAGWIASNLLKADTGIVINIILGIVGASVASFLLGVIGFASSGFIANFIVAILGACILILGYRQIKK